MSNIPKMHTADHLLAVALKEKYPGIRPKAFELGEEKTRAVYESPQDIDEGDVQAIEDRVNEVIDSALDVTDQNMTREEAGKICDISLIPDSVKEVRVVSIGDISREACIGDHVKNTSEMGKFEILELKKIGKNTYKIYFKVL